MGIKGDSDGAGVGLRPGGVGEAGRHGGDDRHAALDAVPWLTFSEGEVGVVAEGLGEGLVEEAGGAGGLY